MRACLVMGKRDTKAELEVLVKATEKSREELKISWKKVEDLDAAIQSSQAIQDKSKAILSNKNIPH